MPFLSNMFGRKNREQEDDPAGALKSRYAIQGEDDIPSGESVTAPSVTPATSEGEPGPSATPATSDGEPGPSATIGAEDGATSKGAGNSTPSLDDGLRDLFTNEAVVDPQVTKLMSRVEPVQARVLARELRYLARAIGASRSRRSPQR